MRMIMLESRRGCEDGIVIKYFVEGGKYNISDGLAHQFYLSGWAAPIGLDRENNKPPSSVSSD